MTKNPVINALAALLYIVLVVSLLYYAPMYIHVADSIFIPIAFLSLFVFSAASMSYIFLCQPLQFLLEGEYKKSVHLFIKTLMAFALSAVVLVAIGLYFAK